MAELNDTESFIYQPTKDVSSSSRTVYYYTILGDHDFIDEFNRPRTNVETPSVVAKTIQNDINPIRYYVKIGPYGRLFNPIGMYSEGKSNKFLAKIGRNEYEFTEVNQQVFDLYINFLTTKNIAWLNNAEREMA